MTIRFTTPKTLPPTNGYSHIAEVTGGKTIYISGQIALDSSGNLVGEGDLRAQTIQVFENLKAALESVGADFSSVVKVNIYMTDAAQIAVVREVRGQYFDPEHPPTSTAVQIMRLVRDDLLIEIDAIAVISA